MRKTRCKSVIIIAVISVCILLSGCEHVTGSVQITTMSESAGEQSAHQPVSSDKASDLPVVSGEVPLPLGMTVYETFFADLDINGVSEKIIVSGATNEYGEENVFIVVFDGKKLIQKEINWGYFTSAFLTRAQSGEYCVLISVDRASEDYVTDICTFDGISPVHRSSFGHSIGDSGYVSDVLGTHVTLEGITDALGTWDFSREYLLTYSFDLDPVTDFLITRGSKEHLHTTRKLPVEMLAEGAYKKQTLDENTLIYPESTDGKSYLKFKLKDGSEGRILLSEPEPDSYCSFFYIEGLSEYEYFDNIEYRD